MMIKTTALAMLMWVSTTACGGSGDKPPSCQDALSHYYAAGCSYFDLSTNPPTPIPEGAMIEFCQTGATQTPPQCQDELNAWLVCNDSVPARATTNADCDCSTEYMALLTCR